MKRLLPRSSTRRCTRRCAPLPNRCSKRRNTFGAATVEFIVDPASREFYFLEVNARLQVEHPVTEAITGLDLVRLQIEVAQGKPLDLPRLSREQISGWAIEARLIAEDPARDFLPSVGKIVKLSTPMRPGIRCDMGYESGGEVTPFYDSLLGKIIAHGPDRESARQRLIGALEETHVLGVRTNAAMLLDILRDEAFATGEVHTGTLAERFEGWTPGPPPRSSPRSRMPSPPPLRRHRRVAARAMRWVGLSAHGTSPTASAMRALGSAVLPAFLMALLLAGCSKGSSARAVRPGVRRVVLAQPGRTDGRTGGDLGKLGVTELYPLAGTFSNDGERLVLRMRRDFRPVPPTVGVRIIHLVYRFDRGAVQHALDDDPSKAAETIARAFDDDEAKAERSAWEVRGLQLDLDCPTRRLPRYGELLAALRQKLPRGTQLSITGLGDWLNGDVAEPLKSVDFWCPQLYEFETPRRVDDLRPLSSIGQMDRYRPRLERLGVPYRIGIAAHGQALPVSRRKARWHRAGDLAFRGRSSVSAGTVGEPIEGEERAAYASSADRVLVFRRPDPRAVRVRSTGNGRGGARCGIRPFSCRGAGRGVHTFVGDARPRPGTPRCPDRDARDRRSVRRHRRTGEDRLIPLDHPFVHLKGEDRFSPGDRRVADPSELCPRLARIDRPRRFPEPSSRRRSGHGPVSLARASGAIATRRDSGGRWLTLGPIVKKSGKLRVVARVRGYGREDRRKGVMKARIAAIGLVVAGGTAFACFGDLLASVHFNSTGTDFRCPRPRS